MIVTLKNKFFSLAGSSTVKDENGENVFKVKGKLLLFSPTRKKKVFNMENQLLYVVRNKWFNWIVHKAYVFDQNKNKICTVKKLVRVKQKYVLEDCEDEISIEGNIVGWNFKVMKNSEQIGSIQKQIGMSDKFKIEASEENIPFIVALVVAIDNIRDKIRSRSTN